MSLSLTRGVVLLSAAAVLGGIVTVGTANAGKPPKNNDTYSVALVGDYNYGCDLNKTGSLPACSGPLAGDGSTPTAPKVPALQKSNAMIADINADSDVVFSIHDGDIKSGSSVCADSIYSATLAQFNTYAKPIVYTPGDNEWTDCHRKEATNFGIQKVKLDKIRQTFFSTPNSLGATTIPLTQQSPDYPENVRWQQGPVTYITIDMPGSDNNFCENNDDADPTDVAPGTHLWYFNENTWPLFCNVHNEAVKRDAANMQWLKDGFKAAKEADSKAVVVVAQADPAFNRVDTDPDYGIHGYDNFLDTITKLTREFDGQVVYVHGDSHSMTFDHPLADDHGKVLKNFTRIQTAGKEDTHWVKMTVDPTSKDAFLTFEPKIVAANVGDNPTPNGLWNGPTPSTLALPRNK